MREESDPGVVEAGEIGEVVVLTVSDAIGFFTLNMLWIHCIEI